MKMKRPGLRIEPGRDVGVKQVWAFSREATSSEGIFGRPERANGVAVVRYQKDGAKLILT